ncbi:hypothetical protein RirG_116080 [Rhizophagus irregularis DAOM 197198w]|uniref:Endonuclease/exonuclease/phosphatase domain-containing protein n=1 Tax=Rhizophagus irregularis (strain DAOM 197198w) TaxID=1432141 RepID=A0A015KIA5_RHIIW|nr:hypothetical protein RirG_116080 [Rhizophagus irregularis DAOM 197198w]
MIDSNIHCLLLTETHLKDPKNIPTIRLKATSFKYIQNNKNITFYIIHNPSPTQSASGVSFIISSLLYQRIQKIEHIPGRLIHITFFFKRHEQLHVLGIYLPPITSSKNNTETLKSINLYLKTHLNSKNQYKKNIIMGDFNINPHKPNTTLTTNDTEDNSDGHVTLAFYHKKFLTTLRHHTYKDIVKIYNETPSYTFKNTSNHTSYIDIIFVSPNLISHTICASVVDAPIHTDHRLILVALNHKFFNPSNINFITNTPDSIELNRKNSLAHNERYNYKKITKAQWVDFKNFVWDNFLLRSNRNPTPNNPQKYVNITFEYIVQSIQSAINAIGFPIIKHNHHQYEMSYKIRILENDQHYITRLIRSLNRYFTPQTSNIYISMNFWNGHKKLNRLKRICSNIDPLSLELTAANFIWSPYLTSSHYEASLKILLKIKNYIDAQLQEETSNFQRNKIEKFINRRDNDLRSNQKRMLTSILDRVPEKIKLDRLVFKDDTDTLTFTTDKDEIESIAIDHYSNIGKVDKSPLAYDPSIPLREEWSSVYEPISGIPDDAQKRLNDLITLEELQSAIKDLPTSKAAGPNKISYEIIKQLPLQLLNVLLSLFN